MEQATGASLTVEVTYKTFPSTLYPTRWKLAAFKVGPTEKDHLCFEEISIVALISISFAGLGLRQEQRR